MTLCERPARRFVYDGWNLVAELDGDGDEIQRSYTWGLDVAGGASATSSPGALLQFTNYSGGTPGASYYPTYDGQGNVTSLVKASDGAIAAVYEYDPFGNLIRNEAIDAAVADNPFRFSTKYHDTETGLVYYGYRYYSPTMGRFINRDPIEESGGINLYGFCGNNGVNASDLLGMDYRLLGTYDGLGHNEFIGDPDASWTAASGDYTIFSTGTRMTWNGWQDADGNIYARYQAPVDWELSGGFQDSWAHESTGFYGQDSWQGWDTNFGDLFGAHFSSVGYFQNLLPIEERATGSNNNGSGGTNNAPTPGVLHLPPLRVTGTLDTLAEDIDRAARAARYLPSQTGAAASSAPAAVSAASGSASPAPNNTAQTFDDRFKGMTGGLTVQQSIDLYKSQTGKTLTPGQVEKLFGDSSHARTVLMEDESLHKNYRNILNTNVPETRPQPGDTGWQKLNVFQSIFHNPWYNPWQNSKYISADGHREAVYDRSGNLIRSDDYKGTFNFFGPAQAGDHWAADVEPYKKWGN